MRVLNVNIKHNDKYAVLITDHQQQKKKVTAKLVPFAESIIDETFNPNSDECFENNLYRMMKYINPQFNFEAYKGKTVGDFINDNGGK